MTTIAAESIKNNSNCNYIEAVSTGDLFYQRLRVVYQRLNVDYQRLKVVYQRPKMLYQRLEPVYQRIGTNPIFFLNKTSFVGLKHFNQGQRSMNKKVMQIRTTFVCSSIA